MDKRALGWELCLPATLFDQAELTPWSVDPKSSYRKLYSREMVQLGLVDGLYVVGWDSGADYRDAVSRVRVYVSRENNYTYVSMAAVKEGLREEYFARDGGTRESLRVELGEKRGRYVQIEVSAIAPCICCTKPIRRSLADTFLCGMCAPNQPSSAAGAMYYFPFTLI